MLSVEEYAKYTYAKKLQYLKSEIKFPIEEQYCGWYSQLLKNYIDDAKTDYGPFIHTFIQTEIKAMIDNLQTSKCPKNKNISDALAWLQEANRQSLYVIYTTEFTYQ